VVLPDCFGHLLFMPKEERATECIFTPEFILVLCSGEYQDDTSTCHPDINILDTGKGSSILFKQRR
jgi:hypothetical protein